jgi:diaminohydroxyphosphoribosylaminopyrimidine deaminase / 5-amino-6-(5-phosphoribosylamino)uracil reductase
MTENSIFIRRCIELAENGLGKVAPNPLVGCVILHNGKIIGEGYHMEFGEPHAEVNAINKVTNKELLKDSTLYVNLEPCSHYGKTPPCSDLIIEMGIPKVVIGNIDPFEAVAGKGIQNMEMAGIKVISGILKEECRYLNRRFLTFQEKKRPYIILKWAQTANGFIGFKKDTIFTEKPVWITDEKTRMLVHKWRSEEQAIMIGTNTAMQDNPQLNVRDWQGKDPIRIVLDQHLRLPQNLHIFDNKIKTLVFIGRNNANKNSANLEYISVDFSLNIIQQIFNTLYKRNIQSLLVEGGSHLLQTFINEGLWDEARIFIGDKIFQKGVKAPFINGELISEIDLEKDKLRIIRKKQI